MADIPGFYFDPVKKKYFRVTPGHNQHNPLTSAEVERREAAQKIQNANLLRRHRLSESTRRLCCVGSPSSRSMMTTVGGSMASSIPNAFQRRQNGLLPGAGAVDSLRRAKVNNLKKTKCLTVKVLDYRGEERLDGVCTQMIGSAPDGQLYALMDTQVDQTLLQIRLDMKEMLHPDYGDELRLSSQVLVEKFMPGCRIQDYCFSPKTDDPDQSVTVTVLNNQSAMTSSGAVSMHSSLQVRSVHARPSSYDLAAMTYDFPFCFLCCTSASNVCFAIGGERIIGFLHPEQYRQSFRAPVDYTAHSLRFMGHPSKPALLVGTHKGDIHLYDNLAGGTLEKPRCRIKASRSVSVISRLHTLERNDQQFIASTFGNELYLYDLRNTSQPACSFSEHVNRDKKLPINVNEDLGLLYLTGADSILRYWSLDSGRLIDEQPVGLPECDSLRDVFALFHHRERWTQNGGQGGGPSSILTCMQSNKLNIQYSDFDDDGI